MYDSYHSKQGEIVKHVLDGGNAVLTCGRGFGKALSLDTPILTTRGWKYMKDMNPGDCVYHPNGQPTRVVGTSGVMYGHTVYDVKFSDGSIIRADAGHLWLTETKSNRKNTARRLKENRKLTEKCIPQIKTTEEIKNTLYVSGKHEHNHSISNCGNIYFPKNMLEIHPYILGVWLGDGNKRNGQITSENSDIPNLIYENGMEYKKLLAKYQYNIIGLSHLLKKLDLIQNKHVPNKYYKSCEEDRLDLVRGLMDSDGHVNVNGNCEFTNKNKNIIDAIVYFLVSLGQKLTVEEKMSRLNGRDCGTVWRVCFTPTPGFVPFKLARKINRLSVKQNVHNYSTRRYIIDVTEVPSEPVKCITVQSEDGLFLAGKSLIATHNSICGRGIIYLSAIDYKGVIPDQSKTKLFNAIAMPTLVQAKKIHWEPLEYLFTETPLKSLRKNIDRMQGIITLKGRNPGILLSGVNEDNGDKLRGLSIPRLFLDEFQDIKPGIWSAISPAVNRCRGSVLICMTPKGKGTPAHRFVEEMKQKDSWEYYHYLTKDNPKLPDIDKILEEAKLTLTPREYRQEYEASWEDFPGQIFDQLDDTHIINVSTNPREYDFCVMGIDWGDINPAISIVGIKYIDKKYNYYLIESWEGNPDGGNRTIMFDELLRVIKEKSIQYNTHSTYPDVFQPGNIDYINTIIRIGEREGISGMVRCPNPDGEDYDKMRKLSVMPSCSLLNRLFYQKRLFLNEKLQPTKSEPLRLAKLLGYDRYLENPDKLISPIDQIRAFRRRMDKSGYYIESPDPSARKHIVDTIRYPIANIELSFANYV